MAFNLLQSPTEESEHKGLAMLVMASATTNQHAEQQIAHDKARLAQARARVAQARAKVARAQAKVRRYEAAYTNLLYGQNAVGMMGIDVIAKLGKPDRMQRLGDESFWYYGLDAYPDPTFQIVLDSGAGEGQFGFVTQVNQY